MTIRINWPSQAAKGLTSIEIYRKTGWNETIDPANLPVPYKVLGPEATSFTEAVADVKEKTCYTYWVAGVKGSERMLGGRIVQGFYLDTGPGPQSPLRGDWYCGYFGRVSSTDFINMKDVKAQLTAAQANLYNGDPAWFHKFIYRGRIIFVPETYNSLAAMVTLYQNGMMFGTDNDPVAFTPQGVAAVAQNCRVKKDGREYRLRYPYQTVTGAQSNTGSDVDRNGVSSEWRSTMGRMYGLTSDVGSADVAPDGSGTVRGMWGDLPVLSNGSGYNEAGAVPCIPLAAVNMFYFAMAYRPYQYSSQTGGMNVNIYNRLVFELILP